MSEPTNTGAAAGSAEDLSLPPMLLPQHGLARFLRVELEVDAGVLRWRRPRTVLGVLPLGVSRLEMPLADISNLHLQTRPLRPGRLAAGFLLVALPFFFLPWWMALLLVISGVWVILVSLGPQLEVTTASGKRHRAAVCFGHQFDADLFIEAVHGAIEPAGDAGRAVSAG